MKWALVGIAHFNTDLIQAFSWAAGRLSIWWLGDPEGPETYRDPDRKHYLSLCRALGLRPVGVEANGEK